MGGVMELNPEQLTEQIGHRLRMLRKERGFTLEQLAEKTGVSKPMLGQIERGESNPTVVTLWKIASGLHVPFSVFLDAPSERATVVRKREQAIVTDEGGRYIVQSLLADRHAVSIDLYQITLLPGCAHHAEAHGAHVTEGIWVQSGSLTLSLGEETHVLQEGDALSFQAECDHTYANAGNEACVYIVLLTYLPS